ncbi:MAG: redoxin domain-containing protein [Gammaproteobacteria bacterium]|nr:alkyl hydroperoxide reductase [Gammaproteobacteria bacterium]MCH2670098.1 redoxin domain-containing protein [Gammaproteobacteria bacterium]MDC3266777.1 redoxin domain-containing protein [Gammaproteobacteria bacterium]|tara:strand:+ start:478 stop:987 length:510 start_codon:yes stop_codon:yes gene_type:complete
MIGIKEEFPDFLLTGIDKNNNFIDVSRSHLDGWSVIYFYPKDFTFICPTEIEQMDRLVDEGVNVFGISGDNEYCKLAWKESNALISSIRHSLLADSGISLASQLGVVDEDEGVCLRATFILNENHDVMHVSVNELDTGRNVNEVIRTLRALRAGGLTGCEWNPGDEFVG